MPASMPKTELQYLNRVEKVLKERGRMRNMFGNMQLKDSKGNFIGPVCLVGAINAVCHPNGYPFPHYEADLKTQNLRTNIFDLIANCLPSHSHKIIPIFNDDPLTKDEDVFKVISCAKKKARSRAKKKN